MFGIHLTDVDGWTTLHYSARYESYELFRCFVDIEADIYLKNNNGSNCLHIAALYEHLNLCKILTDKHNFDVHMADQGGWTEFHYSARYGSYDLLIYFVDKGADISLKDNEGLTCVHTAALHGHLNLCKILKDKHTFDVHMAEKNGWTALHYSTRYCSYDLIKYFADVGADICLKDNDGLNYLHIAALCV